MLVCGRNAERTKRAVEAVGGRAEAVALDLCSLESVRACAEKVKPLKLDVLILNAGVNANVPTAKHPELDCSLVFGVNFVAHYLLVSLLLDSLSEDARVVCLASAGAASMLHRREGESRVDGVELHAVDATRHRTRRRHAPPQRRVPRPRRGLRRVETGHGLVGARLVKGRLR